VEGLNMGKGTLMVRCKAVVVVHRNLATREGHRGVGGINSTNMVVAIEAEVVVGTLVIEWMECRVKVAIGMAQSFIS